MKLHKIVELHDKWRLKECINLIPAENVTSPLVRKILSSDLGHRYTFRKEESPFPMEFDEFYCGSKYAEQVEEIGKKLACKLFNCKHAFLQPLSGHMSAMVVLASLCKPGQKILCISREDGGYSGYLPGLMPNYFGLSSDFLPFNKEEFDLDYERCGEKIYKVKPSLVVLGASSILFPYNIKVVRKFCEEVGAYVGYDASHVLGLIAGGQFQLPLKEGAHVMWGSTHKTLFGPQGGLILTNDDYIAKTINANLKLKMVDNVHLNRIAALAQTFIELLKFGKSYAKQVIKNAQFLGKFLEDRGIPVRYREKGYTRSHQILIDVEEVEKITKKKYPTLATKLEEANIIVDKRGRIGTQEITRLGMREREMKVIAKFISNVLLGEKSAKKVKKEVIEFRKEFLKIKYCE